MLFTYFSLNHEEYVTCLEISDSLHIYILTVSFFFIFKDNYKQLSVRVIRAYFKLYLVEHITSSLPPHSIIP